MCLGWRAARWGPRLSSWPPARAVQQAGQGNAALPTCTEQPPPGSTARPLAGLGTPERAPPPPRHHLQGLVVGCHTLLPRSHVVVGRALHGEVVLVVGAAPHGHEHVAAAHPRAEGHQPPLLARVLRGCGRASRRVVRHSATQWGQSACRICHFYATAWQRLSTHRQIISPQTPTPPPPPPATLHSRLMQSARHMQRLSTLPFPHHSSPPIHAPALPPPAHPNPAHPSPTAPPHPPGW